jgi:hypothetical protein
MWWKARSSGEKIPLSHLSDRIRLQTGGTQLRLGAACFVRPRVENRLFSARGTRQEKGKRRLYVESAKHPASSSSDSPAGTALNKGSTAQYRLRRIANNSLLLNYACCLNQTKIAPIVHRDKMGRFFYPTSIMTSPVSPL